MRGLVGYTGFVGSSLYTPERFDRAYNTKNIESAYGTKPDLLVYAGVRAEKYLANARPDEDMKSILEAEQTIEKIDPQKLVLISTIDVFNCPVMVDERSEIDTKCLHPYGYNRYQLERWVREQYPDALIVRLPGLFGKNLKKNFIYDYIKRIPFLLNSSKFEELSAQDSDIKEYYCIQNNGFYQQRNLSFHERSILKQKLEKLGFTALNFTDSRSVYQFYDLQNLWGDIQTALKEDIRLLHAATEPIAAGELYGFLSGEPFKNELDRMPAYYDFRTIYDKLFGGGNGYIYNKEQVREAVRNFVETYKEQI